MFHVTGSNKRINVSSDTSRRGVGSRAGAGLSAVVFGRPPRERKTRTRVPPNAPDSAYEHGTWSLHPPCVVFNQVCVFRHRRLSKSCAGAADITSRFMFFFPSRPLTFHALAGEVQARHKT